MSAKQIISPALRAAVHVRSSKLNTELSKSAAAYLSSAPAGGKHTLPDLPYDYAALEPAISAETMELHHSKHHNTYVTNLNASLEKLDAAVSAGDVSSIIGLQGALKFNGGGHLNHEFFWESLCPEKDSSEPTDGKLHDMIKAEYGDLKTFKEKFSGVAAAIQGSGWAWLCYSNQTK